jgi:ribosomal protein L11 methyltransferase
MEYLELTIQTSPEGIETLAAILTANGFDDLVLEDQQDLESFLDSNRAYWDYIDESLASHLQGLSQIKLYLEKEDTAALTRLKDLLQAQKGQNLGSLNLTVTDLAPVDYEESWKENYPPQEVGKTLVVLPYWLASTYEGKRLPVI